MWQVNNGNSGVQPKFSKYLKDIFPNWEAMKECVLSDELLGVTEASDDIIKYYFRVIFRRYFNADILFESVDSFKLAFNQKFENTYQKIEKQLELIKKTYELTEDEIIVIGRSLTNTASNDAQIIDPSELEKQLKFIDIQYTSLQTNNKLASLINYINNVRELRADYILSEFKTLFNPIYVGDRVLFNT